MFRMSNLLSNRYCLIAAGYSISVRALLFIMRQQRRTGCLNIPVTMKALYTTTFKAGSMSPRWLILPAVSKAERKRRQADRPFPVSQVVRTRSDWRHYTQMLGHTLPCRKAKCVQKTLPQMINLVSTFGSLKDIDQQQLNQA